ncbi:hypothetical protein [Austwickia chelonae]|nr:hypothetical protein [Austwickia chelonae]
MLGPLGLAPTLTALGLVYLAVTLAPLLLPSFRAMNDRHPIDADARTVTG